MMRFVLLVLLLCAGTGISAELDVASSLAKAMRQARYSEGFEVRVNVLVTKANGAHSAPLKLALIGQISAAKQRLLIRGISPEAVRGRFFAFMQESDGRIKTVQYRSAGEYAEYAPYSGMFDSGLIAWDMLSPWWDWTGQFVAGKDRINGRECVWIRSVADDKNSPVQEVESCVDQEARLALETKLFDARRTLLRTMRVEKVTRKAEGGGLAAKKANIIDAFGVRTDIEVYAGDEQYQISDETFAALERPMRAQ